MVPAADWPPAAMVTPGGVVEVEKFGGHAPWLYTCRFSN